MNRSIASLALFFFLAALPADIEAESRKDKAKGKKAAKAAKAVKAKKKVKKSAAAATTIDPSETSAGAAAVEAPPATEPAVVKTEPPVAAVATEGSLDIKDEKLGTGKEAKTGMTAVVHYTGWLTNGTKFDSSRDEGNPFSFALGGGQVIKGWDEGVVGMKVGGKRKLTIPPALGYGDRGVGNQIPPNSTLVFEVELLDVK